MTIKHIEGTEKMLINILEEDFYKNKNVKMVFKDIPLMISDTPLMGYVALVYDRHSPLRKEDLADRKNSAIALCNFPTVSEAELAIAISDDRTKSFVQKYIKAQHSVRWAQYVSFEAAFYNNVKTMMDEQAAIGDQEKIGKITANNIKILEELERMKEFMFIDDSDKAEEIINFFPEDFCRVRREFMKKAGYDFI